MTDAPPILNLRDVVRHFPVSGRIVHAVNGVSMHVKPRETLALVGESGCGKSTLGKLILGLDRPDSGWIELAGEDFARLSAGALRAKRRAIQMIFQDSSTALDPRWTVADIIREPLDNYRIGDRAERVSRVMSLLEKVGLRTDHANRYPHELSGGQRQRIGIARALAPMPSVIVADEPVSALDVSVRAQVINLLADLKESMGLSLLFISHDIGVVSHISDRIAVMYLGRIVETGPTRAVLRNPTHPYTRGLLDAVPRSHPSQRRRKAPLEGDPPSPYLLPPGCSFADRCPFAIDRCRNQRPELADFDSGRAVACHRAAEIAVSNW
jgi:peptide/nickel transport system ATP-binding protein/oligopeptide transport system ATP-binding protein